MQAALDRQTSYDFSKRHPTVRLLLTEIKNHGEAPREVWWVADVFYAFARDLVRVLQDGPLLFMGLRYLQKAKKKVTAQALADCLMSSPGGIAE